MKLRDYQRGAVDAIFDYWGNGGEAAGNPLVNMATGLGKSATVGEVARILCEDYSDLRVLMLVHVRELVSQNFETLLRIWPSAPVGIYSAGLGKRQLGRRITYAGIQSVYGKGDSLGPIDVVLVDEAHLIPPGSEGMYRTLFDALRKYRPNMRVVGFTATPYRTGSGRLDQGPGRLFDEVVFNYNVGDGVRDGWLAPLSGYKGAVEFDVTGIGKRGGEFIQSELDDAFNAQEAVLQKACDEIVVAGADRRSWLLFGSGVKHAFRIAECLRERGITNVETVTGDTPKDERDKLIAACKRGDIHLTNANVLTTGFDAPGIDLICLLRSTLSTVLYVQMMGRGTRADGVDLNSLPDAAARRAAIAASRKPDCRILDYGGNIRRHGPVDAIWIKRKEETTGDDEAKVSVQSVRARECPSCEQLIPAQSVICPMCGYEDPAMIKPKHKAEAERDINPLAMNAPKIEPQRANVMAWSFKSHTKYGADPATTPPTLRVDFMAGMSKVSEYLALQHDGPGRARAVKWWTTHGGETPAPATVEDALTRIGELRKPLEIVVERDANNYLRIIDRAFVETGKPIAVGLPDKTKGRPSKPKPIVAKELHDTVRKELEAALPKQYFRAEFDDDIPF